MNFGIPLDKMTTEDKLAAMEQLWKDLFRNPESIPSPPKTTLQSPLLSGWISNVL